MTWWRWPGGSPIGTRGTLRSRLTAVVAVTVAVGIAAAALACWFIVRGEVLKQVDRSLDGPLPPAQDINVVVALCPGEVPPGLPRRFFKPLQIVASDGSACVVGQTGVKVTIGDVQVARYAGSPPLFRDGVTDSGATVRVLTRHVAPGLAVTEWRSLDEAHSTMRGLAFLLAGVAVLGIAVAATAGLVIARTTLRPVERLTGAVEHIAQTEDLRVVIPVTGEDEIARLGRSFNAMTAALASSRERQRQLIADAGHELRTPLTSLRTNVDLLLRSEATGRRLEPDAKRRLLGNLKAQLAELSSLVGDLLQLSRPAHQAGSREPIAFHEVVEAAIGRARLRGHGLHFDVAVGDWYLDGDEGALQRAVMNLLDNAVKFSPPGGTVTVRLRPAPGGFAELTVRDQGPGIPDEDLPHVFERFWRSSSARGMPGSGLGLAIVAQAVREAGGEVSLTNAEGGGILARMRLPGTARAPVTEARS
jgi:two-component system sensor histidine kinase MprB